MKCEISAAKYRVLVEDATTYFSQATQTIYDGRNSLKITRYNNENLVIKSFKIPHIINRIAYTFFRDSKAKKSYTHAIKIDDFTPKPIGYVEYFRLGLLAESYYICEKYEYDFTIREPLTQKNFKDKEAIFDAFATFSFSLHSYNIEHLDYSPGNILIKKSNDGYDFKIIDINRMRFKRLTVEERLENFAKLWAKNEDLALIIESYAKLVDMDFKMAFDIALKASQRHKDKKNFKKRLKGKKVVD